MADKQTDVLMMIQTLDGGPVAAGGRSALDSEDTLLAGFTAGNFFEVDEFSLNLELEEAENAGAATAATTAGATASGKFVSWRDLRKSGQQVRDIVFPVAVKPFSFSRLVDRASPILFEKCANSIGFAAATVVKRKATGETMGLQSFLRIDFSQVLIVSLGWTGGDLQTEKCEFICRGLKVQYRQQSAGGALGGTGSVEWKQQAQLKT